MVNPQTNQRPSGLSRWESGHSLPELLMSLALLTGIIVSSQGIWSYAARLTTAITDSNLDPNFTMTASLLRKDLQHPASVEERRSWTSNDLQLDRDDGSIIVWRLNAKNLVRHETQTNGKSTRRRALSGVENWKWRAGSEGLFEVEITISLHQDPIAAASNPKAVGMRKTREVTRRFVIARRNEGQLSW